MTLIVSENFDGVTAPVIPSDIVVKANASSTYGTSTSVALSSLNGVFVSGTPTPYTVFYSGKPDNSNGNCTVSASCYISASMTNIFSGVAIGVGGQWVIGAGNDNNYEFLLGGSLTGGPYLGKRTNGSFSSLGVAPTSTLSAGAWYTLTLTRSGSTLQGSCQRNSDSNWMTSSGAWQSGFAFVFSQSDGSPLPSLPSYGGISINCNVSPASPIYADNLVFSDASSVPMISRRRRR